MRYRFGEFTLSRSRRVLLRGDREVPLIPRYLDLLLSLVERRDEALHRRELFDAVWGDVVVSDGALSQAVRSLRRALGDDPREPVYIRTVARHGYRFVFPDVREEPDDGPFVPSPSAPGPAVVEPAPGDGEDPIDAALEAVETDPFEAAERLHAAGIPEVLRRLDRRPGHSRVRALLRDARWDLPGAAAVPILGQPAALRTLAILFGLRLRRVVRLAGSRWLAATAGGGSAGAASGLIGALVLRFGPGATATNAVLVALPLVGLVVGALGAAGVAAGLAVAEAIVRSRRGEALVLLGAAGGGTVGALTHLVGAWTVQGLFGGDLRPMAGGLEGVVLGGAVGLGYALATPRADGMAAPRGGARLRVAALAGTTCAAAAALLAWSGSHLGAMSLDLLAHVFPDSQVGLGPLSRLIGEARPGPLTGLAISSGEGWMFGLGTILGLTHRPRRDGGRSR